MTKYIELGFRGIVIISPVKKGNKFSEEGPLSTRTQGPEKNLACYGKDEKLH